VIEEVNNPPDSPQYPEASSTHPKIKESDQREIKETVNRPDDSISQVALK
jgi:hypothetical protein